MKARSILLAIVAATIVGISAVGTTLAAGTWYGYDLTIPKFGGSTTTNNQTKQYTGQASISSTAVGADYCVYARLELVNNDWASGVQYICDGTFVRYDTSAAPGNVVHVRFTTDGTTTVDVQAQGNWSPDTP